MTPGKELDGRRRVLASQRPRRPPLVARLRRRRKGWRVTLTFSPLRRAFSFCGWCSNCVRRFRMPQPILVGQSEQLSGPATAGLFFTDC